MSRTSLSPSPVKKTRTTLDNGKDLKPQMLKRSRTYDVAMNNWELFHHGQKAIRAGKMKKLGWYQKSWKNRFCVLFSLEGRLILSHYGSTKDAMDKQPKGELRLEMGTKVTPLTEEEATKLKAPSVDCCFSIVVKSRKLVFCTETVSMMENWVRILREELEAEMDELDVVVPNLFLDDEKEPPEELQLQTLIDESKYQSLEMNDVIWETLLQTDNWEEFIQKFENFQFKLKPGLRSKQSATCQPAVIEDDTPNLLQILPKVRLAPRELSDSVREIECFLGTFYGKGRLKAGWLYKRGKINKSWKRRFCVLTTSGIFEYYKELTDAARQGFIVVEGIESISTGLSENNLDVFHLKTKDRLWHFASPNETTRDDWIKAIDDLQMGGKRSRRSCLKQHRTSTAWRLKCKENMIHIRSDSIQQPALNMEQLRRQSSVSLNIAHQSTESFKNNFCYSTRLSI